MFLNIGNGFKKGVNKFIWSFTKYQKYKYVALTR